MEERTNKIENYVVVEYSVRQDCINITTLEEAIAINTRQSLQKIDSDFRIVGMFDLYDDATKFADMFRSKIIEIEKKDEEIERLTKLLEEKDNE